MDNRRRRVLRTSPVELATAEVLQIRPCGGLLREEVTNVHRVTARSTRVDEEHHVLFAFLRDVQGLKVLQTAATKVANLRGA